MDGFAVTEGQGHIEQSQGRPAKSAIVVERYIAAFNAGDCEQIVALFAENANVEDPIGTQRHTGRDAIAKFYGAAIETGAKLALTGPVRAVEGHAAFPFRVRMVVGEKNITIEVIDTMRFDSAGRIEEMRAYFSTADAPDFLT